jgi:hypothetical protein
VDPGGREALLAGAQVRIREGLAIARRQEAKSLELRGLVSLCRVQRELGDPAEGRQALRMLYNSFGEGLSTHDLREARALLVELK